MQIGAEEEERDELLGPGVDDLVVDDGGAVGDDELVPAGRSPADLRARPAPGARPDEDAVDTRLAQPPALTGPQDQPLAGVLVGVVEDPALLALAAAAAHRLGRQVPVLVEPRVP